MHNPLLGIEAGGEISYHEQAVHKPIIKVNQQREEIKTCVFSFIDPN
jgi:lipoate-protein ligase B